MRGVLCALHWLEVLVALLNVGDIYPTSVGGTNIYDLVIEMALNKHSILL
jgi:hypothetical protein